MQAIEFEIPLPREYRNDMTSALAWQADLFRDLGRDDWRIKPLWVLHLGRHGVLKFRAEREDMATTEEVAELKRVDAEALGGHVGTATYSAEALRVASAYDRVTPGGKREIKLGTAGLFYDPPTDGWVVK